MEASSDRQVVLAELPRRAVASSLGVNLVGGCDDGGRHHDG